MKYCTYCGTELSRDAAFCPGCGARVERHERTDAFEPSLAEIVFAERAIEKNKRSFATALLAFFLPVVGIIIWAVQHTKKPGVAMSAAKGAIASICSGSPILGLVCYLVFKNKSPELARTGGTAAIVGLVVELAIIALGSVAGIDGSYLDGYYAYISLLPSIF